MTVIDDDFENGIMHHFMKVLIREEHHIALKIRPYSLIIDAILPPPC